MRAVRVWRSVLGVAHTVVEKVELETQGGEEVLVATVRPTRSDARDRMKAWGAARCSGQINTPAVWLNTLGRWSIA